MQFYFSNVWNWTIKFTKLTKYSFMYNLFFFLSFFWRKVPSSGVFFKNKETTQFKQIHNGIKYFWGAGKHESIFSLNPVLTNYRMSNLVQYITHYNYSQNDFYKNYYFFIKLVSSSNTGNWVRSSLFRIAIQ